jgi:hypothetical protein
VFPVLGVANGTRTKRLGDYALSFRALEHHQTINNKKEAVILMQISKVSERKRSLGALRKATKTKPRSPDLTGQFKLQRHTASAIVEQFNRDDVEEVVCNIAGWKNHDNNGSYLAVELSPRFVAKASATQNDIIDSLIHDKEDDEH